LQNSTPLHWASGWQDAVPAFEPASDPQQMSPFWQLALLEHEADAPVHADGAVHERDDSQQTSVAALHIIVPHVIIPVLGPPSGVVIGAVMVIEPPSPEPDDDIDASLSFAPAPRPCT
jgi:hypothetical protein